LQLRVKPAVGTVLFTVLGLPALVVVVIPWLISRWDLEDPFLGWDGWRAVGGLLLGLGLAVGISTATVFVRHGRGTPAPWAPPERFVAVGLYRWTRNPMYLGKLALLLGQALVLGSVPLLVWTAAVGAGFHLFVVLHEEPELKRRFGASYEEYRSRVPRWVPHLRRERS
jgi:protein-S-isoprenylcysteine O-methyltransferase Ste14